MKTRALACPGWKMSIACGWLVVDYSGSVRPGPTVDRAEELFDYFLNDPILAAKKHTNNRIYQVDQMVQKLIHPSPPDKYYNSELRIGFSL